MGHQHHLSNRKTPSRALAYLKDQMARHKKIQVETPVRRLAEAQRELETIGLTVTTLDEPQTTNTYGKVGLYFRWNGDSYENYTPQNPNERCSITIQWAWVLEPGDYDNQEH